MPQVSRAAMEIPQRGKKKSSPASFTREAGLLDVMRESRERLLLEVAQVVPAGAVCR